MPPILISRARWSCALAVLVVAAVLLVACAPSDPPPTNPLDDGGPGSTATGPLPTFPATGSVTATAPLGQTLRRALSRNRIGSRLRRVIWWTCSDSIVLRTTISRWM